MSNVFTVNYEYHPSTTVRLAVTDYGDSRKVVGIRVSNGHVIDSIATSSADGCFTARLDHMTYSITTPLEDELIKAGVMRVVGMAGHRYHDIVEVEFDDEWLASLTVIRMLDERAIRNAPNNTIEVGYTLKYHGELVPTAHIKHGDFIWEVHEFNRGEGEWVISAYHPGDSDKGFYAGYERPLVETWLKAMRLERAVDEFVDMGRRIADKYDVSFVNNLIAHVAGGYWYLEG